jgi:hypothetical protein
MTITRVPGPRGRVWGILALVAVALPLPFLFTLNVLSLVVQNEQQASGGDYSAESWAYGLIAAAGLLFFPLLFLIGLALAILAVTRPRFAGRVMGWVAIAVIVLAIPLLWFGYAVWITGS